jgi:hypothetical protein
MAIGASSIGEKPPLVTLPTSLPRVHHHRALAHRLAASTARPTRRRIGPLRQRGEDPLGTCETAFRLAALGNGEGEIGLYRRDLLVKVVAVERQAGLEPQRIAGAEADRLHLRLRREQLRHLHRILGRHRNLETRPRRYSPSG